MIQRLIRRERRAQGLTLAQLAQSTGIAAPNLSRLEKGEIDPRLSTIERVLAALGLQLSVEPRERLTLASVERRMEEGRTRLGAAGITDRGAEARLDWKDSRNLETSVERHALRHG